MAKIRIHELAKELEKQSKDILSFLQEKGVRMEPDLEPLLESRIAAEKKDGRFYGLRTLRQIISRWAPPSENDTRGYIDTVCHLTKWDSERALQLKQKEQMIPLVSAMSQVENGRKANLEEVEAGWMLL